MIESPAILIDTTRCNGCEACVLACKEEHELGSDRLRSGQQAVDGLSATRFSTVLRRPGNRFVRHQCRHCLEPACVSACLVGAMQKTPEGPVVYDSDLCIGCRYCLAACPWGVPRYEWEEAVPYVRKCDLCYERIGQGQRPACVEACPEDALLFGSRPDLLRVAHRRIAEHPERYVPHVYGETEVGGTAVLHVADVRLGFLGWSEDLGDTPLPDLTWASLKKVPPTVVGMAGLMSAVYWVIHRRMRLAAEAAEAVRAGAPESPTGSASDGGTDA